MTEIKITKIEAAQRQIDAGIRMLFRNDDPVAIHTVAMAGFRILRDLAKKKGPEYAIIDSMIRPGKEIEFWGAANSFSNFFKHADHDSNDISSGFREEVNDVVLFIAAAYYKRLGYQATKEMMVIESWFMVLHPDVLSMNVDDTAYAIYLKLGKIRSLPRKEQLAIGLEVLKQWIGPDPIS